MPTTTSRRGGWAALLAAVALAAPTGTAQPPTATDPDRPKLASELPPPKAGDKVTLTRAEARVKLDDDGLQEVGEMVPGKDEAATIPSTSWTLDADGWFDAEGFNVTKAYPRSGLWALRTRKGNRPAAATRSGLEGLIDPGAAAIPEAPARLYRAGPGDILTHIDGIPVTSYDRFVYAVNAAASKRDLPVVVMDGQTGKRRLFYVTAFKVTP